MQDSVSQKDGRRLVKVKGEPGIYRRGSTYVVRHRDPNGKDKKLYAKTLAEARAKRTTVQADVIRGEYRALSGVSFRDYAPTWITSYGGRTRRGISEETRADYAEALGFTVTGEPLEPACGAVAWFGRVKLAAVEPQHVKQYAKSVAGRTAKRSGKPVSATTTRLALAPVKAMFATAVEEGLIRSNPTAGLRLTVQPQAAPQSALGVELDLDDEGHVKALSEAQLAALLAQLPDEWRLFFTFLSETGLRIGEAIEVRWADLDLPDIGSAWLNVRRRFYRGKVAKPKGGKTRRLRVSEPLARGLRGLRTDAAEDQLVFVSEQGRRLDQSNVMSRVLKPAAVRAGLGEWVETKTGKRAASWVGFHTFRHTTATRLFRGGWNAVQVQRFLGHSDPGFTLRTYVHLLPEDLPELPFEAAVAASAERPVLVAVAR